MIKSRLSSIKPAQKIGFWVSATFLFVSAVWFSHQITDEAQRTPAKSDTTHEEAPNRPGVGTLFGLIPVLCFGISAVLGVFSFLLFRDLSLCTVIGAILLALSGFNAAGAKFGRTTTLKEQKKVAQREVNSLALLTMGGAFVLFGEGWGFWADSLKPFLCDHQMISCLSPSKGAALNSLR
ncbi:hypothetical protein ACTXM3_09400 [Glutamicibacter arilaitensis]|uniref:hypothetical protein n=1 Tax=Glutamicibacter arilaitensis TaxID=256701 RepID=UPI003FD4AE33